MSKRRVETPDIAELQRQDSLGENTGAVLVIKDGRAICSNCGRRNAVPYADLQSGISNEGARKIKRCVGCRHEIVYTTTASQADTGGPQVIVTAKMLNPRKRVPKRMPRSGTRIIPAR